MPLSNEDLINRFNYHPASNDKRKHAHETIRTQMLTLAQLVNRLCPDGREKSTSVTKLEEAMFWANAAIARQEDY